MYLTVKLVEKDLNVVAGKNNQTTKVDKNLELSELIIFALHKEKPIDAKAKSTAT